MLLMPIDGARGIHQRTTRVAGRQAYIGLDPGLPATTLRRRDGVDDAEREGAGETEWVTHGDRNLAHA